LTADPVAERARRVAELAARSGRTGAVAESLTSGRLAFALGEAPDASDWFRGAVHG
jgi:nicotinamide-nucleotide amidase